ncbi:MAG: GH1 family beta-glucosidase [Eubacteriales bacterium]
MLKFDNNFIFGVSTSSYQIEGAWNEDGRTPSIWDDFCHKEGNVENGDTGDIACDHYHKYEEDVELLKELGISSYRFSVAWPRIFPKKGEYNEKGMKFYVNLINKLKEANIEPAITLYHWDMPMWAHEEGGWTNRESVDWFLEYAKKCFEILGDKVKIWITHNEPFCASFLGYHIGIHAPGIKDLEKAVIASHHMLLSHGKAVKLFKEMKMNGDIGITINLEHIEPYTSSFNDLIASSNFDGYLNRWFLDPLFKGIYPLDIVKLYRNEIRDFSFVRDGDLEIISNDMDFLGINYYTSKVVKYNLYNELLQFEEVEQDRRKTDMNWAITPEKFKDLVYRIRDEYTNLPIYITENGAAYNDELTSDNKVHDNKRLEYINDHLEVVSELNQEGMNINGYYLWSFMDNFEWSFGYSRRLGIVYIDYNTLKRIKKDSFYWYQNLINQVNLP